VQFDQSARKRQADALITLDLFPHRRRADAELDLPILTPYLQNDDSLAAHFGRGDDQLVAPAAPTGIGHGTSRPGSPGPPISASFTSAETNVTSALLPVKQVNRRALEPTAPTEAGQFRVPSSNHTLLATVPDSRQVRRNSVNSPSMPLSISCGKPMIVFTCSQLV
jgi:hypothetical protein